MTLWWKPKNLLRFSLQASKQQERNRNSCCLFVFSFDVEGWKLDVNLLNNLSAAFRQHRRHHGLSLIELLMALAVTAVLVVAIGGVINRALQSQDTVQDKNMLLREAEFAMQRMVHAVSHSRRLLLPLADNPASNWPENIREQTIPPTPPIGDSTLATAVLAVTLSAYQDLDADGYPDADDDRDGLIDEDLPNDIHYDSASGIALVDDNGDGSADEFNSYDDDETANDTDDDPIDGLDNDNDNNVDEDPASDINGDGCPGVCGVDDDRDGQIDEGSTADDDEDGQSDEDWYNAVVFHLNGGTLTERTPVPWDESGGGSVTGLDYLESSIADNVTRFRVERLAQNGANAQLVDITLEITSPVSGETVRLNTRVRLGGAL
jgi:prepilin-type N-terminal cleavage/methylation domain-containing protein